MTPFNELTEAEDERLSILAEECAEVIQAVMKIQRHGYDRQNPLNPEAQTNRNELEKELGDVEQIVGMMLRTGDVDSLEIGAYRIAKAKTILPYLHHQRENA